MPRHARVVLIGDFLPPLPDLRAVVAGLAAVPVTGHLLQVLDPAEAVLPYSGRVRFRGLEREADALVPRVEGVRDAYAAALAAQQDGPGRDLRRRRLGLLHPPHRPPAGGGAARPPRGARRRVRAPGTEGRKGSASFLKKRSKKLSFPGFGVARTSGAKGAKSFCFFFFRKRRLLLPSLVTP